MIAQQNLLLIPKIEEGFVLDHIPTGMGVRILELMRRHREFDQVIVTLGMHYASRRLGTKDLIKIQMSSLPKRFSQQLSIMAPGVTVKRIREHAVVEKLVLEVPEIIQNVLRCPNPNCISTHERSITTCFHLLRRDPLEFRCNYCERHFSLPELEGSGRADPTLPGGYL